MPDLSALRLGEHDLSGPACHAMLASVAASPGVRASIDADHTCMTDGTVAVLAAAAAGSLAQPAGIGQYMGLHMDTRQLHVAGNQITALGAGTLAELLLRSAHLQVLDVSGNPVGDDGMHALLQAAAASTTLSSLDAEAVGMSFAGLADLASPLLETDAGHRPALSRLNLAQNYLGNDGAAFIAESWHAVAGPGSAPATPPRLPATACLRSLDLRHCGIGPEGACIMAAALAGGCIPLQALRLAGNPIGDDGVRALCAACTPPLGSLDATHHTHASGSAHARLRFTCNVRVLDFAEVRATDDALPSLLTLVLSRARVSLLYWLLTELDKPAMAKWCAALAAAQDPAPALLGKRAGSASRGRPSEAGGASKAKATQLPTIWRDMLAAASQARQARLHRRAGHASSVDGGAPEAGQPSHRGALACLAAPPLQLHLQQNTLSVDACLVLAAGSFCWGLHAAAGPVPRAVAGRERARAKPGLALDTFRQVAAADACRPGAGPGPSVRAVLVAPGLSPGPRRTAMPTEAVLALDRAQPYAASVAAQAVLLRSWPMSACGAGFAEAVQDPAPAVQVKLAGNVHADANFSVWLQRGRAVCALGLHEHHGHAQLLQPSSITPSSGPLELAYAGACAAVAQDELAWLMKAVRVAATYSARGQCSVWRGVQRGLAEEGMAHLDASMRAQGTGFWRGDMALAATSAAAEWLGSHALAAAMPWGGAELLRLRPMSSRASQLPSAPVPHSMLWSLMDRHSCTAIARAAAAHSGNESWVKQFTVVPALLESSDHSAPSWNAASCAALPGRVHGARAALQRAGLQAGMLLRVAPTIHRHVEFRVHAMAEAAARGASPPPRMQAGRAVPAGATPRLQQVAHDTLAHTLALDTGAAPLSDAAAASSQPSTPALLSSAESCASFQRSHSVSPGGSPASGPAAPAAAALAPHDLQAAPVAAARQAAPPTIHSALPSIQATPIRSPQPPPQPPLQPSQQPPALRAAPASSTVAGWQPVGLSAQLASSSPASRVSLIQSWIQSPALSIPMPEAASAPPTATYAELHQRSTAQQNSAHHAHPAPLAQAYASLSSRAVWAQLAREEVPLARPDVRARPAASQPLPPTAPRVPSRPMSPVKQVSMHTCSVAHIVPKPGSNSSAGATGSASSTLAHALASTTAPQPSQTLALAQGATAHLRPQAMSRRASKPSQPLSIAVDAAACRLAPPAARGRASSPPAKRSPSPVSRARRQSPARPRSGSPAALRASPPPPPAPASSAPAQIHPQRASPRSSPGLTVQVITRAAAQPAWSGLPAAPAWQPIGPVPGTARSPATTSVQFPELHRLRERLMQLSSMSVQAAAQQERAASTPPDRAAPERPPTAMSDWLQSPCSAPGSRRHADAPAELSPPDSHQSIADVAQRLFQWEAAAEGQHAALSSSSASSGSFLASPEPGSLPSQGSPSGLHKSFSSTLRTPLSSELLSSARLSPGSSSSEHSAGPSHAVDQARARPASTGAMAEPARASLARASALLARMPDLADMASHLHDISSSAGSDSADEATAPAVKSLPISPEVAASPAPAPARSIPPPHVAVPSARAMQPAGGSSASRPRVSRGRGLKLPGSPAGGTRSSGVSFSSTVEVRTFPRT